ncbi:MAG TPA: alpha/beta hydrolase [Beijerinckiaceae bacterium]|jgi:arylformamidase
MSGIDLEAEYNNRARVPEHPAIIEGWARDAAAYRTENPPKVIHYGESERQIIDLFPADGTVATVAFIHGGYWQGLAPSFFSHLARGLNAHGLTVGLIGYDLCPAVRVGDIIEQVRRATARLAAETGRSVVASGHSAGGHLAACLLATDWARYGAPEALVRSAYAISGVFDLEPLIQVSQNAALRLDEAEARAVSPVHWTPPPGIVLDAAVGALESSEFLRQSRLIAEVWGRAGVTVRYDEIAGTNHFTVVAPLADPASPMTRRVAALATA